MSDYLEKAYCMNQTVRIFAANTTNLVKKAQEIFNMWPSSIMAFGRVLTISAIMSCTYKNGEFLNIKVDGDGPIGRITVEATDGKVRGFVQNPGVFLQNKDGKINVADAVGAGMIEVIKDLHLRQPFSSSSEIISGEIADDFTYYFAKSEQIPSSVALAVNLDKESKVVSAGGFLIQVMPGCKQETIDTLEKRLKEIKPISKMIEEGYTPEEIINEVTMGDYQLLEKRELKYECNCSKERFERGLKSIGKDSLLQILNEDKHAHITCNFCKKEYEFSEDDLKKLIFEL